MSSIVVPLQLVDKGLFFIMKEVWKDLPNYEGIYKVSNLGRVKSMPRDAVLNERILNGSDCGRGYIKVSLHKNGKRKDFKVHKLIAIAFLGHIPCGMNQVIDHIDENKKNNRVDNLQVVSNRYNCSKYRLTQNKTSKYTGVHWNEKRKKWVAQITINNKLKALGRFINEEDAHNAYQKALNNI